MSSSVVIAERSGARERERDDRNDVHDDERGRGVNEKFARS